jgi:hypothetical protein
LNRKIFALHPGAVTSISDGDRHKLIAPQLADLYGVPMSRCVVWDEAWSSTGGRYMGMDFSDYLHLYPLYRGDYPNLGRFL